MLRLALGVDSGGKVVSAELKERSKIIVSCNNEAKHELLSSFSNQLLFNGFNVIVFDSYDYERIERLNRNMFFPYAIFEAGKNIFVNLDKLDSDLLLSAYSLHNSEIAPSLKHAFESSKEKTLDGITSALAALEHGGSAETSARVQSAQRAVNAIKAFHGGFFSYSGNVLQNALSASPKLILVKLSKSPADQLLIISNLRDIAGDKLFVILNAGALSMPQPLTRAFSELCKNFVVFSNAREASFDNPTLVIEHFDNSFIASDSMFKKKFFLKLT